MADRKIGKIEALWTSKQVTDPHALVLAVRQAKQDDPEEYALYKEWQKIVTEEVVAKARKGRRINGGSAEAPPLWAEIDPKEFYVPNAQHNWTFTEKKVEVPGRRDNQIILLYAIIAALLMVIGCLVVGMVY